MLLRDKVAVATGVSQRRGEVADKYFLERIRNEVNVAGQLLATGAKKVQDLRKNLFAAILSRGVLCGQQIQFEIACNLVKRFGGSVL